jgi:murein DD-endopeptidase MepM/ murein hydrolase activator NlpD
LGGTAIVLVGVVAAGTVVERASPSPTSLPAGTGWDGGPTDGANAPGGTGTTPGGTSPAPGGSSTAAGGTSATTPSRARDAFPVAAKATYARTHHDYPATDIIANCGSPVLAVTDGVMLEVSREDAYNVKADDGALRGGLYVSLLGDDGVRYYGSHLRLVLSGIDANVRVRAGQVLGQVGDTGDAGVCHLHFGISPPCARTADWWVRRGVIWPWSYLDAWRAGTAKSPAPEITEWAKKYGCPGAPA